MKILLRSDLKRMLEERQDFLLLNVLSASSFQQAHIAHSENIPVAEPNFVSRVESLLGNKGKEYPIVTYCGGFHCSASKDAANQLIAAGHTQVSAFEGGMEDWLNAGYPASCDDAAACKEHCSS